MFLNLAQISISMTGMLKRTYFLCKSDGVLTVVRRVVTTQVRNLQRILKKEPLVFGMQGDLVMKDLLQLLAKEYAITSIIETGTYQGHTTLLLGELFPSRHIYSCELTNAHYLTAKKNTKNKPNITLFNLSSPQFLNKIIHTNLIGELPLFFLDAHWLDHWPLEKELSIITSRLKTAIIIIDDFKVPGHPRFAYDTYDENACAVDLLKKSLNKKNKYTLLLPKYHHKDAYKKFIPHNAWLVGHAIIFQNLPTTFSEKSSPEFISTYFEDKTQLLNTDL